MQLALCLGARPCATPQAQCCRHRSVLLAHWQAQLYEFSACTEDGMADLWALP